MKKRGKIEKEKKDGSKNYAGVNSPVVDYLIEKLIGAKTREELTTAIHALDRVLLWGHYVIPLYHSNTDRIAYWNFLEYPEISFVTFFISCSLFPGSSLSGE